MRVIRRPAYQGHALPTTVGYPRNPFDPAVVATPRVVHQDQDPEPYGATAQNGYLGLALYRCSFCGETVTEDEVDAHSCLED